LALKDRVQITNVQARQYLRVDDEAEDVLIEPMIDAALEEVEGVLNHDFTHQDELGATVEDPVPGKVTIAALRMLGSLYEWRDFETGAEKVGDETRTRRKPEEEREALRGYLWQHHKIAGLS
jgi:hypothetical protein